MEARVVSVGDPMPHPKGGYRNSAGVKIPSTTGIIGRFKESGALLFWAFEQGKAAQRGEINSLYDKRDEAADFGTRVHALVESSIKGEALPDIATLPEQVQSGLNAYLTWASMTKLKIVEQEVSMTSEVHQFGGTLDAIGEINGELCLLDWKTSKAVYQDMLIQLAAYNILWTENFPDRPLHGFHLCRFSKEHGDFSHHFWKSLPEAHEQFILLRRAYDLDKQLKARAA
jgi:hypothetical protein